MLRRTSIQSEYNSERGTPVFVSAGSMSIPLWSSDSPSSLREHSIPLDSAPRILDFLISNSSLNFVPIVASATMSPVLWFGAPQTTCRVSLPVFTLHRVSLSASGCFSTLSSFAVYIVLKKLFRYSIPSISAVDIVSLSAIASGVSPDKSTIFPIILSDIHIFLFPVILELIDEPDVAAHKVSYVIYTGLHHDKPVESHAEGKA